MLWVGDGVRSGPSPGPGPPPAEATARLLVMRWGYAGGLGLRGRAFAGLTAAWEVAEGWRVGVCGGVTGNYPVGRWLRRGALPIVQWKRRNSGLIWEAGLIHRPDTTFVGLGVHVPCSLFEAK